MHWGGQGSGTPVVDPGDVNVFGEMRGVKAGQVRAVGDANFQQHTHIDQGFDADVAIDPTGKWMVFASTRDNDHTNLYSQAWTGRRWCSLRRGRMTMALSCGEPGRSADRLCLDTSGELADLRDGRGREECDTDHDGGHAGDSPDVVAGWDTAGILGGWVGEAISGNCGPSISRPMKSG